MSKSFVSGPLLLLVLLLIVPGPARCQTYQIDSWGTFVMGVECLLFQADMGGLYLAVGEHACGAGDRARIIGTVDMMCTSVCMQGDGCLEIEHVFGCTVPEERTSWGAIKARYHQPELR
jgi:hypothetical protein